MIGTRRPDLPAQFRVAWPVAVGWCFSSSRTSIIYKTWDLETQNYDSGCGAPQWRNILRVTIDTSLRDIPVADCEWLVVCTGRLLISIALAGELQPGPLTIQPLAHPLAALEDTALDGTLVLAHW